MIEIYKLAKISKTYILVTENKKADIIITKLDYIYFLFILK